MPLIMRSVDQNSLLSYPTFEMGTETDSIYKRVNCKVSHFCLKRQYWQLILKRSGTPSPNKLSGLTALRRGRKNWAATETYPASYYLPSSCCLHIRTHPYYWRTNEQHAEGVWRPLNIGQDYLVWYQL